MVTARRIFIVPTVNALGYNHKSQTKDGINQCQYFPYNLTEQRNIDKDKEDLNKKFSILEIIVNVLILKIILGWEQTQINPLFLTIFGFQWNIFRLSSSYSKN